MTSSTYTHCKCSSTCSYLVSPGSCSTGYAECVDSVSSTSVSSTSLSTSLSTTICSSGYYWVANTTCSVNCNFAGLCDHAHYCSSGAYTGGGCTQANNSVCSPSGCKI